MQTRAAWPACCCCETSSPRACPSPTSPCTLVCPRSAALKASTPPGVLETMVLGATLALRHWSSMKPHQLQRVTPACEACVSLLTGWPKHAGLPPSCHLQLALLAAWVGCKPVGAVLYQECWRPKPILPAWG